MIGSALLAFAVLVRPAAVFLPLGLAAVAAMLNGRRDAAYHLRLVVRVGIVVLLVAAGLVPWGWRNHRVLGRWVWTTTNGGITLYDGFNPRATGASDQSFVKSMPELATMNELERSDYLFDLARRFVRDHPLRAIELALR